MDSFQRANNSETSSEEIDQPEKLTNDDNAGMGRLYECNFCKRGFSNAQALGGHMNIHRKDKDKLAKATLVPGSESSISNKLSKEYMACSYLPPFISDETSYYSGLGSQLNYQTYVSTQSHHYFNANSEHSLTMGNGSLDPNLSLGIGKPYADENEERKRWWKIDKNTGEEVDLELRLGHNP